MLDKKTKIPAFLNEKLLNARTIEEAVILTALSQEEHPVSEPEKKDPLPWNSDKPLCQHCLQELAVDKNYCSFCSEILKQNQELKSNISAGVLVHYQHTLDLINISEEPFVLLNDSELLILLPHFKVADFLCFLKETASHKSPIVNIIFPGRGDMLFCDALAMARYYAKNIQPSGYPFINKFFFNHSHMRSLSFEDFYSFNVAKALFEMASKIKPVFPPKNISVILDLLKKDDVNRVYELNRFYSMCNNDQKTLLNKIEIDESDPKRVQTLFQMVRYVQL